MYLKEAPREKRLPRHGGRNGTREQMIALCVRRDQLLMRSYRRWWRHQTPTDDGLPLCLVTRKPLERRRIIPGPGAKKTIKRVRDAEKLIQWTPEWLDPPVPKRRRHTRQLVAEALTALVVGELERRIGMKPSPRRPAK
jgi:hypothetical protein